MARIISDITQRESVLMFTTKYILHLFLYPLFYAGFTLLAFPAELEEMRNEKGYFWEKLSMGAIVLNGALWLIAASLFLASLFTRVFMHVPAEWLQYSAGLFVSTYIVVGIYVLIAEHR